MQSVWLVLVLLWGVVHGRSPLPSCRLRKKIYEQYHSEERTETDLLMPDDGESACEQGGFGRARDILVNRVANCIHTGAIDIQFDSCCDPIFLRLVKNGIYPVRGELRYCDMETDGGGWLVIQRRDGGMRSFNESLLQYKRGFGELHGEFWLGLQTVHAFTQEAPTELRVDMKLEDGTKVFAKYSHFQVDNEANGYRLNISGFDVESTAGDGLGGHSGARFSTHETDTCAIIFESGWWFTGIQSACADSTLNAPFVDLNNEPSGVRWKDIEVFSVEMKIRSFKWECGNTGMRSTEELFLLEYGLLVETP